MRWAKEEEEVLRQMQAAELSLRDMMRVLPGKTTDSIMHKLTRLGLKIKPKAHIDYEALVELMSQEVKKV